MKRFAPIVSIALSLAGCCDASCDCRKQAKEAKEVADQAMSAVSAVSSGNSTAAEQAAMMIIRDVNSNQDQKAKALQLLFELERGRNLDSAMRRLDDLTNRLEVLMERKVERER